VPIAAEELVELRPWAYHSTTPTNFAAIRIWHRLRSAADLLEGTEHEHLLVERRTETAQVTIDGVRIEIRDQKPLHAGHIVFDPGFTFGEFLAELNDRTFMWAGTAKGPVDRGDSHYARYAASGKVMTIRCRLNRLMELNQNEALYVTKCNSGAPRSHPRKGLAERGPSTFCLLNEAEFGAKDVKEMSYRRITLLPDDTEWTDRLGPAAQWQLLWARESGSNTRK
jgi:hypothetical protein